MFILPGTRRPVLRIEDYLTYLEDTRIETMSRVWSLRTDRSAGRLRPSSPVAGGGRLARNLHRFLMFKALLGHGSNVSVAAARAGIPYEH